jgi:hypothetical protein
MFAECAFKREIMDEAAQRYERKLGFRIYTSPSLRLLLLALATSTITTSTLADFNRGTNQVLFHAQKQPVEEIALRPVQPLYLFRATQLQ